MPHKTSPPTAAIPHPSSPRRRGRREGLGSERGASAPAFLLTFVIVLLVAELIVVGARLSGANAVLSNAAREAARQGSLVQTSTAISPTVDRVAFANLERNGQSCSHYDALESWDFNPGGHVTVLVTCVVDLDDLSFLGLPLPDAALTHSHREPIETYRVTGTLGSP